MTIADINELKNRFKVGECTIKQIAGAYVDSDKNIVTSFNKPFQSLETTEYHKYLDIVKSIYSSKVDDNVMTLEFYNGNVNARDNLDALIANELKDVEEVQLFFEDIVNKLNYVGNYLILLFFDQYDVIKHAKDGKSLDESEETYSYIQCIICPVELEKGGLQYKKNENDIGAIDRDWIIKKPRIGFVYPAFEDRSADINKVMYFTSDAKDPMQEVISEILECHMKFTITQTRERFKELFLEQLHRRNMQKSTCRKLM